MSNDNRKLAKEITKDSEYNGQTTEIKNKKKKKWGIKVGVLGSIAVVVWVLSQFECCNCNTCTGRTKSNNEKETDDKDLDISGNETENQEDIESVIDDLANKIVKSGVANTNIDEVVETNLTISDTLVEAAKNWKEQLEEQETEPEVKEDENELDESKDDVNTNSSNSNKPSSTSKPNENGNSNKENSSTDSIPEEPMQPEQPVEPTPTPVPPSTPTPVPPSTPTTQPSHEHKYELIEEVQPTCTTNGYKVYKCSVDGSEKREDIPALGHSAGKPQERPGDNNTIIKETICTHCGIVLSSETIKNPDKIDSGTSDGNGQPDIGSGETDEIVFPSDDSNSMDNIEQPSIESTLNSVNQVQDEIIFPFETPKVSGGDANDISSRKNALMELRMFCQGVATYQFIENYSMIETVEDVDLYTVKSYHA